MKLSTMTSDFDEFFKSDGDKLKAIFNAGFRYADLSMYYGDLPNWIYMKDNWEAEVESVRKTAEEIGIRLIQSHTPGALGTPLDPDEKYDHLVEATKRSLEVCGRLGIKNAVIHTGWSSDLTYSEENKQTYFDKSLKFLENFFPVLEKYNTNILVENSTKKNMGNRYFFYTGEEMKEFIRFADHPLVHACWDVGHANLENRMYEDIIALGDDLKGVHIHDNKLGMDEHLLPFQGNISLDELMHGLIDSDYKGYFTFELDFMGKNSKRKVSDKDQKLLKVPLFIQEDFEKILYKTGKYILETYDCFEV